MTNLVARMMIESGRGGLERRAAGKRVKADALTVTYPGMRSFIPAMVTPLAAGR